ncbi:hypothetical protein [Flavobacterium mesophilum]|uniref:hypothetical protein n=1 Tax=Flavobacterium mesophilum TaxID=3143495 RepID=UPI0031E458D6
MTNILKKSTSLLVLAATALLACCQNDEEGISQQESAVSAAKEWLEKNDPGLEALQYAEAVSWENAVVLDNDGEQAIEVPLELIPGTSANVTGDTGYKTHIRLLLIRNPDAGYKIFDIVYSTKDASFDNDDKAFNILDIGSSYSGYITIQKSDNSIAYSGKYEEGKFSGLHNYISQRSSTSRLVCSYYVTVGPYTTCSNWVWYPDYASVPGGNTLPPGYMPGISGPLILAIPILDPCKAAVGASMFASNPGFVAARAAVAAAGANGYEHSITLGTPNSAGTWSSSPIQTNANPYGVAVNDKLPGAMAAIHNHPHNTALSTGDIYAAVTLNTKVPTFTTSFIVTAGQTYAIVVTDLAKAQNFVKEHPADLSPNYPPEFPDDIFDQIDYITSQIGGSIDSKTAAISSVLDKYDAGITLMKQESDGKFSRFKIEKNQDGSYVPVPCK